MKTKYGICLLIVFVMLVTSACSICGSGIQFSVQRGSGRMETEEREVSDFSKVSLSGIGELTVIQGDEESLVVRAEDNIIDKIETEVRNGTLYIDFRHGFNVTPSRTIEFEVTMKEIEEISLSGAGNIEADLIETDELELNLSGAGSMEIDELYAEELNVLISGFGSFELSGEVEEQNIMISGAGSYNAGDLCSQDAVVDMSAAGTATIWAEENLDVSISGAGELSYYGNPRIQQSVSGVGRIQSRGDRD